ncbi:TFIIB-type zinc ribbon-containing protein [Microbulbifer hainanensis]|uniref:TFIIB-type zinc ribbon-containing protein n=1 Tax=Microbulbifer hainanensis TaxID=2735675 RepID=UPI00186635C2|nr:zf-TFIIB domain-containing protein [Microbulbifer hainanensis]
MKCPSCSDAVLLQKDRNGIEIDYCPNCRGIWLDRGELEKIIERSAADFPSGDSDAKPPEKPVVHKQKRNLITELFDF